MPLTALERQKKSPISDYAELRDAVRKTLLFAQQRIEREKVLTYWKTGRHINDHIRSHGGWAEYGKKVLEQLSEDLHIDVSVLRRCARFAAAFPIQAARPELSWAHYRALLAIPDEKERLALAEQAGRLEWSSRKLEEKVKRFIKKEGAAPMTAPKKVVSAFKPKRGTIGAYRVVLSDVLLIDLGFSSFIEHPALQSGRFKEGDIVSASAKHPALLKDATAGDLYTYKAEVEKVVDADTFWLWIHLGFDVWVRQKVRLRGIDAPELDTKAGLGARRFVESVIASPAKQGEAIDSPIVVTTTKPDKYDRYLSDIWIGDTNLNQLLLESGHARPKTEYSHDDWDLSSWGRF